MAGQTDVEAVTATATEYFQSWFAGDGERMRACLHPALAKRTPEEPGSPGLQLHEDPREQLVADTAAGEGTGFEPRQEVTVLDIFQDIATVCQLGAVQGVPPTWTLRRPVADRERPLSGAGLTVRSRPGPGRCPLQGQRSGRGPSQRRPRTVMRLSSMPQISSLLACPT